MGLRAARAFGPLRFGTMAVVVLCLVAVSLSAPNVAAASPGPRSGSAAINWTACDPPGSGLECARVPVPLDWDKPNGKQIELAVIRHLASRPAERIGSMFVNPGGPGASGIGIVQGLSDMLDTWGAGRFDVVSWDPRGTNASTPVNCFTSDAARDQFWAGTTIPFTRVESKAYQRKTLDLARRCGQVNGDLLDHISTADTARDLDALRGLVGDDLLTYVGLSYGTMIGQTYINLFPKRIRAMVLDGIVDPVAYTKSAEARVTNQSSAFDAVFGTFQELCESAGAGHCALAGHRAPGTSETETVAQRVARVFDTARTSSIPAPHSDPPGALDYADLIFASFNPLRMRANWAGFAADLNAAADGDASAMEDVARTLRTPAGFAGATTSSSISCLDGSAHKPSQSWPSVIPKFTDTSAVYGPLLGWWLWAPCASNWPGQSTDRYAGPWGATTTTPILLMNNRHDPATGYQNAVAAEQRLGNAVLLTEDGYGHLTMNDHSQCVDQVRTRYLLTLVPPARGTVCKADVPPFP
jgi:pimeloyl-ACP methyl ester carboxylesterase